jgi:type 2 lantibiotic biosynthesis protein LanM
VHKYYPEFDTDEIDEVITPLAVFDEQIADLFVGGQPTVSGTLNDSTRTALQEWQGRDVEHHPFQRITRSIVAAAVAADPLAPFAGMFHDPRAAFGQWLDRAETRVREVWTRPLVTAVHRARECGGLTGADPHERYEDFVAGVVRDPTAAAAEFPILRDVTRVVLRHEVEAVRELCSRLTADRAAIAARFAIDVADRIRSFGFSAGDAHHRGRTVSVIEFGSGARLVYKPRDVSCEAAYVHLAREVNERYGTSLAAATVLQRDGYGYVKYVETTDVADVAPEFLRASGELAAVLYLLNARDMHLENIVPTRRGPVPIDLETILHPARVHTGTTPEAPGNAYETIGQSIYGIGILPLVMVGRDTDAGHVDLGFLGDRGRGSSPFKSMRFSDPFTDRIRLVLTAQPGQERQTVAGSLTEAEVHRLGDAMAEGFTTTYRVVLADRDGWTDILRRTTAGVRVRYVHNPTALYAQTLRMAAGAAALADPSVYTALLKRIAIASKNSSPDLVGSELRQLAVRDVPYFTVAGTGTALEDGDGAAVGASVAESPLDRALAKIACLGEPDLDAQLRLLRSAFSARFPDNHLAPPAGSGRPAAGLVGPAHGALAALASRLADDLVATSKADLFAHLPRTWIGPLASTQADRPWPPAVLGYDLYTGRVGPALALAAAGRVLDRAEYRALADQIFSATAGILADRRYEMRSVRQAGYAGYTGTAGLLFALAAAGRLLERADWVTAAQGALPLVLDQVREVRADRVGLDVISGVAGVLSCVDAVGGPHADSAVADLTPLLTSALLGAGGHPVLAQSGFAHGISGVVNALSRVHPRLPDEQRAAVRTALSVVIARLRDHYEPVEGDWFSGIASPRSFATGWCHGPTGIALALSAYGEVSGDPAVRRDRDIAVGNMLRRGFGRNLTWCHGDLGNHDVLSGIARTADPPLRAEVARIERTWLVPEVLERKLADHRSRYAHTSSLMVGTAGVLLHLTNRLDPGVRVSPVALTVDGPAS